METKEGDGVPKAASETQEKTSTETQKGPEKPVEASGEAKAEKPKEAKKPKETKKEATEGKGGKKPKDGKGSSDAKESSDAKKEEPKEAKDEKEEEEPEAQKGGLQVTPNSFANDTGMEVDYDKLIEQFGCEHLKPELLARFESLIKQPLHRLLRRGLFVSHRDFGGYLDRFEKGTPIYLYTGRGPSSVSMHLGHLLPFMVTKWLQDVFRCPTVIQLTDDEKFFYQKSDKLDNLGEFSKYADENAKDIIACGFDPELTLIFKNTEYINYLYPTAAALQRALTYNQVRGIFGLSGSDNIGKSAFPPLQAAPCVSTCFPHTFGSDPKKLAFCLIPHGIDQDPYFRMTRDLAARLHFPKPTAIHSKFFPGLRGFQTKMSASDPTSAIFLTDTPAEVRQKINSYAFSGGRATVEEHRRLGADLKVDVPYAYLSFFLEDDAALADIGARYGRGELLTGEVKKVLIECLNDLLAKHQKARAAVTPEILRHFMTPRLLKKL